MPRPTVGTHAWSDLSKTGGVRPSCCLKKKKRKLTVLVLSNSCTNASCKSWLSRSIRANSWIQRWKRYSWSCPLKGD